MAQNPARRALKVDCLSGISGDMFVSALYDLLTSSGKDGNTLIDVIAAIKQVVKSVKCLDVKFSRVDKNGFAATFMNLDIDEGVGHDQTDVQAIDRNLIACMDAAGLVNEKARTFADSILDIIVDAESRAHGLAPRHDHGGDHDHSQVHLHELASVDTLIDILCVTRALELLGFFDTADGIQVFSSPVSTGRGSIKTAHGIIPVPAPGTLEILKAHGILHVDGPIDNAELATPTGCAILAALKPSFEGLQAPGRVIAAGSGAGTKTFPALPNVLRLQLLDTSQGPVTTLDQVLAKYVQQSPLQVRTDVVTQLTLVIDDMTPEDVGYLIEKMYKQGALEVYMVPAQMKKQRPGIEIIVLCSPEAAPVLITTGMEESTTLGCRVETIDRVTIDRLSKSFRIQLAAGDRSFSGEVTAKFIAWRPGTSVDRMRTRPGFKIEHDDLKRVAESLGTSINGARSLVERVVRDEIEKEKV